jgi:hypothetical protein
MQTFTDLLMRWPSLSGIGRELGCSYDTVMAWKRRNSIPYEYWPALIASAKRLGILGISMNSLGEAAEGLHELRKHGRQQREHQGQTQGRGRSARARDCENINPTTV